MNKLIPILAFTAISIAANAQLQNTGFEDWQNPIDPLTGNKPVGWTRSNGIPSGENYNFYHQPVTDPQSGNYALRLSIWYTYDEDMAYQEAPIASRPAAFTGYYTYTDNAVYSHFSGEVVDDEARVFVYLTKWNAALSQNDTIGTGYLQLAAVENYTQFNCPITYTSDATPDKIKVILDASLLDKSTGGAAFTSAVPGGVSSILTVDSLALVTMALGNDDFDGSALKIYPNPVADHISISGFEGQAVLFDATGKIVRSADYSNSPISANGLQQGIYLLMLDDGGKITSHKILKQ